MGRCHEPPLAVEGRNGPALAGTQAVQVVLAVEAGGMEKAATCTAWPSGSLIHTNVLSVGAASTPGAGDGNRARVYKATSAADSAPHRSLPVTSASKPLGACRLRYSSMTGHVQMRCANVPRNMGSGSSGAQRPDRTHSWQFRPSTKPAWNKRAWGNCLPTNADRKAPFWEGPNSSEPRALSSRRIG